MHLAFTSIFLHSPLDMRIKLSTLLYYRYRENAQRLSRIYRDQPLTPLQQAVYWTEYVIRHKGAPHLRSAVLDLAWYQYFLLDVIALLAIAVGSAVVIVFLVLRALWRKLFSGRRCVQRVDKSAKKRDQSKMLLILLLSNGVSPKFYLLLVSNIEQRLKDRCLKQLLLRVKEIFQFKV